MTRRPSPRGRALAITLFITVAIILVAAVAFARPGGGGSYRGGGGGGGGYRGGGGGGGYSGGGGGSGGNGFAIAELIILCFEHPLLGLIVLLVGGIVFALHHAQTSGRSDWSTTSYAASSAIERAPAPPPVSPRTQLAAFRRFDESFSVIVFEDFVYALYAQVHAARGRGTLDTFSAYLSPESIAALAQTGLVEVKAIIVGALRIWSASASSGADPMLRATVEIEANYTEVSQGGQEHAWYVRERWSLLRRASAPSRTPDKARLFACPSCGAPLEGVTTSRCRYCNKNVRTGDFDWIVRAVEIVERQARGPMLTAETQEEGTSDPTVVDPEALTAYAALTQRDPAVTWEAFASRVGLVFQEFQRAWAARDLASMRPFLSDNLHEVETYWVRAYEAQRLRNVTENARITRLDLARVTSDRFFDAVTVRLFATSLDYTLSTDHGERLVCGSRSRERSYTEYWTFIRSARRTGAPRLDGTCPSCGAPLAINMAGHCTYCKAKVTSGDFDWVLSRIEQDESYGG